MSPTFPDDVQAVVDVASRLGTPIRHVAAVGLVGSYARGTARPASDVDLIVLTGSPEALLRSDDWFHLFDPAAELVRVEDFGAIQERRLRLPRGLVVDVGIGRPSWAAVDPVDAGTRRVVSDGLAVLYDPINLLGALMLAVPS